MIFTVDQVVSTLSTASASLIGSLSNGYLSLPILNVGGNAARPESRNLTSGGYLLSLQPDIFLEMRALVRLILDMKMARDALDGRWVLMRGGEGRGREGIGQVVRR